MFPISTQINLEDSFQLSFKILSKFLLAFSEIIISLSSGYYFEIDL